MKIILQATCGMEIEYFSNGQPSAKLLVTYTKLYTDISRKRFTNENLLIVCKVGLRTIMLRDNIIRKH